MWPRSASHRRRRRGRWWSTCTLPQRSVPGHRACSGRSGRRLAVTSSAQHPARRGAARHPLRASGGRRPPAGLINRGRARPVRGGVFHQPPPAHRPVHDRHQPDHRQLHLVLVGEVEVRTGRVALHRDEFAARRDSPGVDDVAGERGEVAPPRLDVGVAADERRLVEHLQRVVDGHEPAETVEVRPVDAVDEADRDGGRRQRRTHGRDVSGSDRQDVTMSREQAPGPVLDDPRRSAAPGSTHPRPVELAVLPGRAGDRLREPAGAGGRRRLPGHQLAGRPAR